MSTYERCVEKGSSKVCISFNTADNSCIEASYNGDTCQDCTYQATGLCTTTTSGYALNCQNVVNLVDMKICGEELTATVPASDDGGQVKMGALVFFIILFVLSLGVRIYAEVRRCREGLDGEETQDLKKKDEIDRDVELAEAPPEENKKGRKNKNNRPEEPLNGSSKRKINKDGSKKKVENGDSEHKKRSSNKDDGAPKKRSASTNDLTATSDDGSKKSSDSKHRKKPKKKSSSKNLGKKSTSAPVITAGAAQSSTFDFEEVAWDQPSFEPTFDDAFAEANKKGSKKNGDDGSVDSTQYLPGDRFEAYDELKGDVKATNLRKYHRKGDWEAIRSFFHKIRRRIIERQHYIGLLVQWIAADWPEPVEQDTVFCEYLDEWNAAEPDNLQCNVIRLEVWIAWAWHGRTKAYAHEIAPERVELFYDRMDNAAAELERTLQVTKKRDALVFAAAIKIATGRNDDQAIVQQYMKEVQSSNDPANYLFHTRALEYFCEKWHGSHDEMMDYAKWITSQLPDGHPLWILIPVAHYECVALMDGAGDRMSYWHKQHDTIVEAYQKALSGPWELAVNPEVSPACQKLDAVVRNWFVYALGKCRATELAQRQARVIGKRPLAELPWDEKYTYMKHVKNLGFVFDSAAVV